MKVLLDSHIVFWTASQTHKLSKNVVEILADSANICLVSPINHWEMAMKMSIGGYAITTDFNTLWDQVLARFTLLPIEPHHSAKLIDLPFHHRDPFDRMLIAQAIAEDVPLISSDRQFKNYPVRVIW